MLRAGILDSYFLKPAFLKLTDNIRNCPRDSPISLDSTLIKLLNRPCTHSAGNHSVNLLAIQSSHRLAHTMRMMLIGVTDDLDRIFICVN